jgi:hypothetical protein
MCVCDVITLRVRRLLNPEFLNCEAHVPPTAHRPVPMMRATPLYSYLHHSKVYAITSYARCLGGIQYGDTLPPDNGHYSCQRLAT